MGGEVCELEQTALESLWEEVLSPVQAVVTEEPVAVELARLGLLLQTAQVYQPRPLLQEREAR
jgi:hypothetical protein